MVNIEISFSEISEIHRVAEIANNIMDSGENVLVSHRPPLPGVEPKYRYRKWFRSCTLANAALVEKDIREGCGC